MELSQDDYKLTGIANDADGQYKVTGTVMNEVLVLECKSAQSTMMINAKVLSESDSTEPSPRLPARMVKSEQKAVSAQLST